MEKVRDRLFGNMYNPYSDLYPVLGVEMKGWSSTGFAFDKAIDDLKPNLIIEVGTWKGASAINMAVLCAKHHMNFEIVCIDTFLGSVEHWVNAEHTLIRSTMENGRPNIYRQFLSNVIHHGLTDHITPFPIDSINGGLTLKQLNVQADLVYIDAGHEYESVSADLNMYKDLVRPGGYLMGDDWFHPPIKKAVQDVLGDVETITTDKFIWKKPS